MVYCKTVNLYHEQELLQCGVLLEKLHKLSQSQLQRLLLARHEEASANVQRQTIEWRRVELHKIFTEELEEATRMGELDKTTARTLQHEYLSCQVNIFKSYSPRLKVFKTYAPFFVLFCVF